MLCAAVVVPTAAYAAVIAVPNTFTNGTIADADEVNANFGALVSESNDQDSICYCGEFSGNHLVYCFNP